MILTIMNDQYTNNIAQLVKEQRRKKKLTQQQLADLTGLSLRSVQRLENGEAVARMYTLEVIGKELDLSDRFRELTITPPPEKNSELAQGKKLNNAQKVIISVISAGLIALLIAAYIFQSPTFPETAFELTALIAGALVIYAVILFFVWR